MLLEVLFWSALKLLLGAFGILYVGLVLMSYKIEGPRCQWRLDVREPARSAGWLLVWLGVKALFVILRAGKTTLDMLTGASADVGQWYIRWRGRGAAFRTRFL